MPSRLIQSVKRVTRRMGFDIVTSNWMNPDTGLTIDFDPFVLDVIQKVRPYTMTSPERILALCTAIEYLVVNRIPGAIVECGVWKGGSVMAALLTLRRLGDFARDIYLFDTFSGMTDPTREDTYQGTSCLDMASKSKDPKDTYATWGWQPSGLEETQKAVYSVGYPDERLHFVVGPVEQTLPEQAPAQVALLRLDTDFYKSTLHELEHLYPRMPRGGVLIIDDYGHADGVRLAVDQFFRQNDLPILLNRIDYTGRVGVKL